MTKLWQVTDFKEINQFYSQEFRKFKLHGFWDVTAIVRLQDQSLEMTNYNPPWQYQEFLRNLSAAEKNSLNNRLAHHACSALLKSGEVVWVVPIFVAYDTDWIFDQEIDSIETNPWVVFFRGNDDVSHGMRFASKIEMLDWLSLGVEVGETPLAWHN
jgi:hypothetical protein